MIRRNNNSQLHESEEEKVIILTNQTPHDMNYKSFLVSNLTTIYRKLQQATYGILTFPMGIVLSMGPILLNEQKNVPLQAIGFLMAFGEALGIVAMKITVTSKWSQIMKMISQRRPHHHHFDLLLHHPHWNHIFISVALILMPVWPSHMWYLSGAAMAMIQAFHYSTPASTKPTSVIGESLHRIMEVVVLTTNNDQTDNNKYPGQVLAQAKNRFERIGNVLVGSLSPILYALVSPSFTFYAIGGGLLMFHLTFLFVSFQFHGRFQECFLRQETEETMPDNNNSEDETNNKDNTMKALSIMIRRTSEMASSVVMHLVSSTTTDKSKVANSNYFLSAFFPDISKTFQELLDQRAEKFSNSVLHNEDNDNVEEVETVTNIVLHVMEDKKKNTCTFKVICFLVIQAIPFWDAAISRFPYAFFTVAITKDSGTIVAAGILFFHQMGRAMAQSMLHKALSSSSSSSHWFRSPLVTGYVLNSISLLAYVALVLYLERVPDGTYWFVPFAILGLSETLPIQEYYLRRLYSPSGGNDNNLNDNWNLHHAVQARHTSTGLGSMFAFVVSSQLYVNGGIQAVSYVGGIIQLTNLIVTLFIDGLLSSLTERKLGLRQCFFWPQESPCVV